VEKIVQTWINQTKLFKWGKKVHLVARYAYFLALEKLDRA